MQRSKSDGLLGGMIIGAAIGAIAGILAAPRAGRDTRRILKKSADALPELAEDLATSIQFQADRLSESSLNNWEETLARLREAVIAGRAAGHQEWVRQADGVTDVHTDSEPDYESLVRESVGRPASGLGSVDSGLDSLRPPSQPAAESAAFEDNRL